MPQLRASLPDESWKWERPVELDRRLARRAASVGRKDSVLRVAKKFLVVRERSAGGEIGISGGRLWKSRGVHLDELLEEYFQASALRGEFQAGEFPDEREQEHRRKDRGEKHSKRISAKKFSDGELVAPEDGLPDAPARSETRVPEFRWGDGTVPSVSVSALPILFACEAGERFRQEKFLLREKLRSPENLRRESPENFAHWRANNYFFARIRFAWLRFARGLPESKCSDASDLLRCKHAWRVFVILLYERVPCARRRRHFALAGFAGLADLVRGKSLRRKSQT